MLENALTYLARGWSVIPVQQDGKRPLVEWAEFNRRLPTEDEVRDWWGKWPDANLAVVCGRVSRLVVVDVDTGRGGTTEGLQETGLVARTGGGGYHYFYQYPVNEKRVRNRVGKDGVDVRADGGYVVVAPSTHKSGGTYQWLKESEPSPCPTWVLRGREEEPEEKDHKKWLSRLIEHGTSKGTRNDDVAKLTGYLAKKELPRDVAEAFVKKWNKTQVDPLPEDEVEVTVRSVFRTARRNEAEKKDGPLFDVVDFSSYARKHGSTEVSWLVDEWLPDKTIAFTVAPPGSRKTWLLFDLATSVATGKPFLGRYRVNRTGPVLVIQQEDFHGQVAERLATILFSKLGIEPSEGTELTLPPDVPIHVHPDRRLRFDDEVVVDAFSRVVERIRPALVIIDPLYSAVSTEGFMAQGAEQLFVLKHLRDKYDTTFFVAHHTKKSATGIERQDLWGSQFLNAFLESGWQVRKNPEDEKSIFVNRHFKVSGSLPHVKVSFDISTKGEDHHYNTETQVVTEEELEKLKNPDKRGRDEKEKQGRAPVAGEAEVLVALGSGPLTEDELFSNLNLKKKQLSRAVGNLKANGQVSGRADGRLERVL